MNKDECPLCGETVARESKLLHLQLDRWLLKLVRKAHPNWSQADGACPKCWEEIRKLKKEAKGIRIVSK